MKTNKQHLTSTAETQQTSQQSSQSLSPPQPPPLPNPEWDSQQSDSFSKEEMEQMLTTGRVSKKALAWHKKHGKQIPIDEIIKRSGGVFFEDTFEDTEVRTFSIKCGRLKPPKGHSEGKKGPGIIRIEPDSVKIDVKAYPNTVMTLVLAMVVNSVVVAIALGVLDKGEYIILPGWLVWWWIFTKCLTYDVTFDMNPHDTRAWYLEKKRVVCLETEKNRWIAVRPVSETENFLNVLKEVYGENMIVS